MKRRDFLYMLSMGMLTGCIGHIPKIDSKLLA